MLNIKKKSHKTYHNHAAFQCLHAPVAPTSTSVKACIIFVLIDYNIDVHATKLKIWIFFLFNLTADPIWSHVCHNLEKSSNYKKV